MRAKSLDSFDSLDVGNDCVQNGYSMCSPRDISQRMYPEFSFL